VEFCPECAEPIENYSRPAGFWIRVGAHIIDSVIFLPFAALSFWNMFSLKSIPVLILMVLMGLIYKPFMEAFFGATLGKMACKVKVIDAEGNKLSLLRAYVRYLPFLVASVIGLATQLILFSSPEFQAAETMIDLAEAQQKGILDWIGTGVNILILIECVFAAFTFRKRALHDMLAKSFCVYKES
jgi:uncharacterized RDD family membrane protein YckC